MFAAEKGYTHYIDLLKEKEYNITTEEGKTVLMVAV